MTKICLRERQVWVLALLLKLVWILNCKELNKHKELEMKKFFKIHYQK